jgi:4-hydroxy-3-methylbut-2-enyl diphosphate reductase
VTVAELQQLSQRGCTLVDTTCGSVLNVWKNVRRYAARDYTSVIHGKIWHEETQATASQATAAGGRFLIVLNEDETSTVCDYVRHGGNREVFLRQFSSAVSPAFDPDRDLVRLGLANQTTMLMSESLEIGEMLRKAVADRYGADELDAHYLAFDTICRATQDRQDAVVSLLRDTPLDQMVVIGGYNSSNTCNLARICATTCRTFHIADPECLLSPTQIRHRPVGTKTEVVTTGWLPATGPVRLGLTSGASTPDNLVGTTVLALERLTA